MLSSGAFMQIVVNKAFVPTVLTCRYELFADGKKQPVRSMQRARTYDLNRVKKKKNLFDLSVSHLLQPYPCVLYVFATTCPSQHVRRKDVNEHFHYMGSSRGLQTWFHVGHLPIFQPPVSAHSSSCDWAMTCENLSFPTLKRCWEYISLWAGNLSHMLA